jgi:hypothetical protein
LQPQRNLNAQTSKRENDLAEVIDAHPELLGAGLYESTAIFVEDDKFEVWLRQGRHH